MLELSWFNFCYVLEKIWEWVRKIAFRPCTGLEKNIEDCLFLYQVLDCLTCKTFRNTACLCHVYAVWRWYPILLDWPPTLHSHYCNHLHSSLESLFEHSSHIQIFGKMKNVWQKVTTSIFCTERYSHHFIFFQYESEDISCLMNTQSFA